MIKWIIQDVRRNLKSRKTLLLLMIIIISVLGFIFNTSYNKSSDPTTDVSPNEKLVFFQTPQSLNSLHSIEFSFPIKCRFNPEGEDTGDICNSYDIYIQYMKKIEEKVHSEYHEEIKSDLSDKEFYKLKLFLLDKATDIFLDYYNDQKLEFQATIKDRAIDLDKIVEIKEYIKLNISSDYKDFKMPIKDEKSISVFNNNAIELYESYVSYENNLPIQAHNTLTSSFFIANFIDQFFLLFVMVGVLLIFDSFYRDYKTGVIKTILSSPTKRYRYVLMKTISSIISMLIIIISPLLITSIILYFKNGFDTSKYPILISRTTLSEFDPVLKYSRILNEYKPPTHFSKYVNVYRIGPVSQFTGDLAAVNFGAEIDASLLFNAANVQIIILSKYIFLLLVYFVLIIFFLSALNSLCSLIFNHSIINLVVLSASIGLNILTNKFLLGNGLTNFIPFTFLSPTALLMGTKPYTFYNGVITLVVWIVILNIITYKLLKKKDFTY